MQVLRSNLVDLPSPTNISIWWNLGSMLGLCLGMQIVTGLVLSMFYTADINTAFTSVVHIMRDVDTGWVLRAVHSNGASMFFILMYIHVGRGVYYGSYVKQKTWNVGVIMLLMSMGTAFLGYVLPWGQMSFWGATVITNLLSAIPYLGPSIVEWVWGGFSVSQPTLMRIFSLHFLIPFGIAAFSMLHLMFLHEKGGNNPLGIQSSKVIFHPFFTFKDIVGFLALFLALNIILFAAPQILGDPENYNFANPMVTPVHIQPEWYFLFAYAILRCIPNKLGGVIALAMSVLIFLVMPLTLSKGAPFYYLNQLLFWTFVCTWILLTWLGACAVEEPYVTLSMIMSAVYFSYFVVNPLVLALWDLGD